MLVNGDYGHAWREVGLDGEPYISATDLNAMLGSVDRSVVQLAFAPPGETVRNVLQQGGQLQLVTVADAPPGLLILIPGIDAGLGPIFAAIPSDRLSKIAADPGKEASDEIGRGIGRRATRGMGMTAFLRSPAALVNGVEVTRQDVIAYVANKLGGAHYDRTRRDDRFRYLDRTLLRYMPTGGSPTDFAFAELLSIAEFLTESSDVARFLARFKREARRDDENRRED